jgi:hypothetical protein
MLGNLYEIFSFWVEENHGFPRAMPQSNFRRQLVETTPEEFTKSVFPKTPIIELTTGGL